MKKVRHLRHLNDMLILKKFTFEKKIDKKLHNVVKHTKPLHMIRRLLLTQNLIALVTTSL